MIKNEQCWVLLHKRTIKVPFWGKIIIADRTQMIEGQPATVQHDWAWIDDREDEHGDLVGSMHTQPGSYLPSLRDIKTFRECWWTFLSRPTYHLIETMETNPRGNVYKVDVLGLQVMDYRRFGETIYIFAKKQSTWRIRFWTEWIKPEILWPKGDE